MERRFAELLVDYCLEAQPGQNVLLEAGTAALPLVEALYSALLQRGAYPFVKLSYPGQDADFFQGAGAWLERVPPVEVAVMEAVDASLRVISAENPLDLADVDPESLARHRKAWRPLSEARLRKRWSLTLYPTAGFAQQAGMSTRAFRRFVERALFLDHPDPIAAWRELSAFQDRLIARLAEAREIRVVAPGTDIRLGVAGRTWINSDGKRNMPSGEVFTAPHEDAVEGEIRFNLPAVVSGQRVEGIYLRFEGGEVVEARARQGEAYLLRMLEADAGARRLGEFGIGTNFGIDRPTGIVLFDEKIGGTVHFALGNAYPESGGRNASAVHWDIVLDLRSGGKILVDGAVLQEDGRFVEG
ncbi:aminopeptidase [Marinithermus hydrothermalis]|uniref:Peptidase M29 aminopeptidase II n=1 Tax=Marinithermus hydrothermalis (strain DSM 14884 / JCM 11576 / T1) TaxID=869210 RepID=F2NPT6_MARHT|nr:aminopeptidase [Marinithermus hydrothermalis]AEB12862.1 peptidase M29 aminopeptidase II [Marinithermus hydrothermalis DSM 14884]